MIRLRHWIPSALTSAGIGFAAISVQHSVDGFHRSAAYWVMLCVLTDRMDGAAARALKSSSLFGAQLDSFADFVSFGIAPATAFYAFFSSEASAGWTDPVHRAILAALSFFYLLAVAFRLARFNITTGMPGTDRFFFGVPTTFTGGLLVALFTGLLMYGDPAWTASDPSWDHLHPLGDVRLDGVMRVFPWFMLAGGIAMVSTFRMPKLRPTKWKALTAMQALGAGFGYLCGLTRFLPEYLVFGASVYLIASAAYHFSSTAGTGADIKPPRVFADVEERERMAAGGVEMKEANAG